MTKLVRAAALAAAFVWTGAAPADAATPSEAFNCTTSYSASLDAVKTLAVTSRGGKVEADHEWSSTYYSAGAFTVFGFTPYRLEYYWDEDDFGASDGFISQIATTAESDVRAAVFRALGVSGCSRMSGATCIVSRSYPSSNIEIRARDGGVEIGCWFDE